MGAGLGVDLVDYFSPQFEPRLFKSFLIIAFGTGSHNQDLKLHVGDIHDTQPGNTATTIGKEIGKNMVLGKVHGWEDDALIKACTNNLNFDQNEQGNYIFTCNVNISHNQHDEHKGYNIHKHTY